MGKKRARVVYRVLERIRNLTKQSFFNRKNTFGESIAISGQSAGDRLPLHQIEHKLLSLSKELKNFQTFIFIIQIKGHPHVHHIQHNGGKLTHFESNQKDFFSLSQKIKKRIRPFWLPNEKIYPHFKFMGPFLAYSENYQQFNFILFLTEDSFFDPPKEIIQKSSTKINQWFAEINHLCEKYISTKLSAIIDQGVRQIPNIIHNHQEFLVHYFPEEENWVDLLSELLNTLYHELGNPLYGLKLANQIISTELEGNVLQELSVQVDKSIDQCLRILQGTSLIYRLDQNPNQQIDLEQIITETLWLIKCEQKDIPIYLNVSKKNPLIVDSHPSWPAQIVFNLLLNALHAVQQCRQEVKHIEISLSEFTDFIRLSVADNGPGLPVHIQWQVLTPNQSNKKNGRGLGLSICQSIAKKLKTTMKLSPIVSIQGKVVASGTQIYLDIPKSPHPNISLSAPEVGDENFNR